MLYSGHAEDLVLVMDSHRHYSVLTDDDFHDEAARYQGGRRAGRMARDFLRKPAAPPS